LKAYILFIRTDWPKWRNLCTDFQHFADDPLWSDRKNHERSFQIQSRQNVDTEQVSDFQPGFRETQGFRGWSVKKIIWRTKLHQPKP